MFTLKYIPALVILIALLATAGCGQDENEMSKLNSSIAELTGSDFEVPLHEDYPLVYTFVRKPPVEIENGPYFITLQYSIDEVELVKIHDDAIIKELEESQGISIFYGPYEMLILSLMDLGAVTKERNRKPCCYRKYRSFLGSCLIFFKSNFN